VGLVPIAGTHPLAGNNQFLPDERDFRGCGFISARLEPSSMSKYSIFHQVSGNNFEFSERQNAPFWAFF
jgi:hypothetical protein